MPAPSDEHVHVSAHPLVQHHLLRLRDAATPPVEFRELVRTLTKLLIVEATTDLRTVGATVRTPLADAGGRRLDEKVGIVPILRAGLGMAEAILDLIPDAEVWHLGMFRDEATLQPTEYYNKITTGRRLTLGLVLDPMLATGGSAIHACQILRANGIERLHFLGLIAAPEGAAALHDRFPDVPITVGAVDEKLNEVGFIYPGLGDAGDRQFGTT